MRYRLVLPCFLLVLAACTFDDGSTPSRDTATARAGQDISLDIGSATLFINRNTIGTDPGQLPPGTRVSLTLAESKPDRRLYSPVYKVEFKDSDGDDVSGLALSPPAALEISYDESLSKSEGVSLSELVVLEIDGSSVNDLTFTAATPTVDAEFNNVAFGRARLLLSSPRRYAAAKPEQAVPPPPQVALTGTASNLASSTIFQLADAGSSFAVSLALRASDTDTPPIVVTLDDAAFNSANPLDPNNRLLTVQTGGNTYTTDHANASVVVQIDAFSAAGSSGSMLGTVVRQGGSEPLAVNFTFTTGGAAATALAGGVTEAGGRRTIALTNAAGDETLLVLMPDNLPNVALDPVTFDEASFSAATPFDPALRIISLRDGNDSFNSDHASASVTVTFSAFDEGDLTGAGTITGVVSDGATTRDLNYTFNLIGGTVGGNGSLDFATAVNTPGIADQCAVAGDGTDFIVARLAGTGATNRTIEYVFVDGVTFATFGDQSHEPSVDLSPEGGFAMAATSFSETLVVAATGADAATANLRAIFFDTAPGTLLQEVDLGTGAHARVQYHIDQDLHVVAWQSGDDVMAAVFEYDGTQVGTTLTAFSNATLAGLAAAGDTGDEALITATDGSGVQGRYIEVSTGNALGAAFNISTEGGGGLCVWEAAGSRYLVTTETVVAGFFTVRLAVTIPAGTSSVAGDALPLPAIQDLSAAAWGSDGAILISPNASLFALDSGSTGATLVGAPVYGSFQGGLDVDVSATGPAIASLDNTTFLMASARGASGMRLQPITLVP